MECPRVPAADQPAWSHSYRPYSAAAEPAPVKEKPDWGGGVSAAAAAEGLYATHDVVYQIEIEPEVIHLEDIASLPQNALTTKEDPHTPKPAGGADAVPERAPTRPGEAPHSNTSVEQQYGLRSCFVRLERLPMDNLSHSEGRRKLDVDLTKHAQTQTDKKPRGKRFLKRSSLSRHKYTDADYEVVKPNVCDICHKGFFKKHHLTMHIRIHTGEKPHCCDVCDKRFSQPTSLTRHKQIHMREKPYCCNICHKRFTYEHHLNTHVHIHTWDRPLIP